MASIEVDTRKAFLTIAKALDYVGIDDVHHSHRVAYMAFECAKALQWSSARQEQAFYTGLLHDCGVSSSREHLRLLENMAPTDVNQHCVRGFEALQATELLKPFAVAVRYHHTPWHELKLLPMDEDDRDMAALIHLADRVDFLRARYVDEGHPEIVTLYEGLIAENVLAKAGTLFNEQYAHTMADLVQTDGFWYAMEYDHIESIGMGFSSYQPLNGLLNMAQLKELAIFLANIVDAKSPFTFQHSEKVGLLAQQLAKDAGQPETVCEGIYISGLLHDVGKLRTPDEVLNHPGKLDERSQSTMRRHAVDTLITLDGLFPNSDIGRWAANHHERLDGSGYPYRLKEQQLDVPSRIIALVDVFQALSQKRPYKGRLSLDEIFSIIEPMVLDGKLDKDLYGLLVNHGDRYYQLAIQTL